ncbi:protein containing L-fucose isomerase-like, C-terminal domain [Pseudovibrio sp. FO-BEG1]|uniref:L-fucose/L-arabinose isomerase family protein n=1 Tax=Pseudovibrio sp. (strain FO-BEG1) TaxID=911045 RepID=UPI000238CCE4|nr:L-fucose/L-arabinose isomerase family protein [Pseudovibrio sp. FO-BEG1]AEV36855.1 protein containing L-fucose isomerase-like, C-terminal domain [Pseudovibrio sp. FO-BEG1]
MSVDTPRIGIVALGRPTFDVPYAEEILAQAWKNLQTLDAEFVGEPKLLFDADAVKEVMPKLQEKPLDMLLLLQVTFTDATMTVELGKAIDAPLVMWSYPEARTGGRLRLNSFCGVNLASHALSRSNIRLDYVHAAAESPKAIEELRLLARAGAIVNQLKGSKLKLVGEHPDGFDACNFNEQELADSFGISVDRIPVIDFIDQVKELPDEVADAPYERRAKDFPNLAELDQEATCKTLKVYSKLRTEADEKDYAGVAVRCWPDFFTEYGCAACGALALLNEDRTPSGCEADMMGVVTSLTLQHASGNSVFNTDLVDVNVEDDTVVFWHCGQAPIDMADRDQPVQGTIHSNRKLPLLSEFALKPGRITMARFSQGHGKLRLILAGGEMVRAPLAFSGTAGTAKLDTPVKDFMEKMIAEGLEHHTALTYGDHRPVLRALAKRLGIEVVELT